ncbi:hypothetical protein NA57DRAFT_75784 [Rhizodiscina lignyota]|uniref:Uncharacterized protein n=1 Tax=Rhizodiscina lignyota TaxID=1504668 RepID=A0A9P4MA95_9PEZI|nr:hypothetical protein NA57DRAFT_75784 [Rhizodiscina lignyota]
MGRQANFLKLAHGRSAFEPPDDVPQSGEWPPPGATGEPSREVQRGINIDYVQKYDEKGHPVNEMSREFGRARRAAYNDCLAAIGVIARKEYEQAAEARLRHPRAETDSPRVFAAVEPLFRTCLYLIGSTIWSTAKLWPMRVVERLYVLEYPPSMTIMEILISQYQQLGFAAFFYPNTRSVFTFIFSVNLMHWLDLPTTTNRLILASVKSRRIREALFKLAPYLFEVTSLLWEFFEMQIFILMPLQGLGLVSHTRFLPSLQDLNPHPTLALIFGSEQRPNIIKLAYGLVCSPLASMWVHTRVSHYMERLMYNELERSCFKLKKDEQDNIWYRSKILRSFLGVITSPMTGIFRAFRWVPPTKYDALEIMTPLRQDSRAYISAGEARLLDDSSIAPGVRVTSVDRIEQSFEVEIDIEEEEFAVPNAVLRRDLRNPDSHTWQSSIQQPVYLPQLYPAPALPSIVSCIMDTVGNYSRVLMVPLRFVVLRNVARAALTGSGLFFAPYDGATLWQPRNRTEWTALAWRVCFCCGLKFTGDMAIWYLQTAARHARHLSARNGGSGQARVSHHGATS